MIKNLSKVAHYIKQDNKFLKTTLKDLGYFFLNFGLGVVELYPAYIKLYPSNIFGPSVSKAYNSATPSQKLKIKIVLNLAKLALSTL